MNVVAEDEFFVVADKDEVVDYDVGTKSNPRGSNDFGEGIYDDMFPNLREIR